MKNFYWRCFVLALIMSVAIVVNWANMTPVNAETNLIPSERMLDDSLMFWEITGKEIKGSQGRIELSLQKEKETKKPAEMAERVERKDSQCIFSRAEEKYGVHRETLQSLWHKESKEGKEMGNHSPGKVMDRRQFDAYKKVCRQLGINPADRRVSRTGDMGQVQFQPITWLAYGVDGNGDGKADPWNLDDAIMSAANYLSKLNYGRSPWTALSKYNGGNKSAGSRQAQQYAGNILRNAIKKGAPIKL